MNTISPSLRGSEFWRLGLIALASYLLSMAVLFRGVVTDLGLESFGRIWMFHVSYTDFGFGRRMLLGTVIRASGLTRLFDNEYYLAYGLYAVTLTLAFVMTALMFLRSPTAMEQTWLQIAVFFSPAFLVHLGHATGSLDLFIICIFMLVLLARNQPIVQGLLVLIGPLIHELFVVLIPAIVVLRVIQDRADRQRHVYARGALLGIAGLSSTLLVLSKGRLTASQLEFESRMAEMMPSAQGRHQLWSGYFEIAVDQPGGLNPITILRALVEWNYVPTLYAVLMLTLLIAFARVPWVLRFALALVAIAPKTAVMVAGDFYRWVSMSAIVSLLSILNLYSLQAIRIPTPALVVASGFGLLGPFGGAERSLPFPLWSGLTSRL